MVRLKRFGDGLNGVPVECYKCGATGHWASACPNQNSVRGTLTGGRGESSRAIRKNGGSGGVIAGGQSDVN